MTNRSANLAAVADDLPDLARAAALACHWLTQVAMVLGDELGENDHNAQGLCYGHWRGAFRGEYAVAERRWWFFCPVWHGGQAVKALAHASLLLDDAALMASAKVGADFILRNQVTDGPDQGLLLAYEDEPDRVNTSAILEAIDGLYVLADVTGERRYVDAGIAAVQWCLRRAWIRGQGLVLDLYDPAVRTFADRPYRAKDNGAGRPLADDAIWLKTYERTRDPMYREAFYEIMERLLQDERPAGNWIDYGPADADTGSIHPRHAYWWGRPMLDAWRDTGDQRWLDAAIRAGHWYRQAQRVDGGIFYQTFPDFRTTSFGHATSGIMCAAILWIDLFQATKDPCWLTPIARAFQYGLSMQFTAPQDANLLGCLLEQVAPPDGTDRNPYHIRDLGTIFFVQAASHLLREATGNDRRGENGAVPKSLPACNALDHQPMARCSRAAARENGEGHI